VPNTSRRLRAAQIASRSRPSAWTATRPPVMKKDACRSKSRIWRFRMGLSPPWVVMSTGTDSGAGALWGTMRANHAASRGPAASVMPWRARPPVPRPGPARGVALADQLARAPAAGLVRPGRLRTDRLPLGVPVDLLPVTVLLRVPVAGEDLDERLPLRVVLRGGQLLVEPGPGRRVETPGRAVRDDDRVEAPLRELLVELLRRLGRLVAIGGQRARVDARRAERHVAQLELELLEVEVALAVRPVVQRTLDGLPEWTHHAHRADQLAVERADRAPRHVIVVRVAE